MGIEKQSLSRKTEAAYQEGYNEGYQLCLSDLMILLTAWEHNREELLKAAAKILEKTGLVLGYCTPGIQKAFRTIKGDNKDSEQEESQDPKVEIVSVREGGPEKRV